MSRAPRVLTVAGLDPCGGAGIVADVRTIALHGGVPLAVAACTTVQNRHGFVRASPVAVDEVAAMLAAVAADGPVDAVKTGMVTDPAVVAAIVRFLDGLAPTPPLVVDPVLSATAGGGEAQLARSAAVLRAELVPRAALVTPNLPELDRLAGGDPGLLLAAGAGAVLVKGGHGVGDDCVDVLHTAGDAAPRHFRRRRLPVGAIHGTGCALAAALAARLARGEELGHAVAAAGDWLAACIAATAPSPDRRPQPLALVAPWC